VRVGLLLLGLYLGCLAVAGLSALWLALIGRDQPTPFMWALRAMAVPIAMLALVGASGAVLVFRVAVRGG